MGLSELGEAIRKAQLEDWSENGRCSMCSAGDSPDSTGAYHHHKGQKYECGNYQPCMLCKGCLPPGEICAGCYRKNMLDVDC